MTQAQDGGTRGTARPSATSNPRRARVQPCATSTPHTISLVTSARMLDLVDVAPTATSSRSGAMQCGG